MPKNIILVLMYHRHKLLDLIYGSHISAGIDFWTYVDQDFLLI
jgi:hypothetical protein